MFIDTYENPETQEKLNCKLEKITLKSLIEKINYNFFSSQPPGDYFLLTFDLPYKDPHFLEKFLHKACSPVSANCIQQVFDRYIYPKKEHINSYWEQKYYEKRSKFYKVVCSAICRTGLCHNQVFDAFAERILKRISEMAASETAKEFHLSKKNYRLCFWTALEELPTLDFEKCRFKVIQSPIWELAKCLQYGRPSVCVSLHALRQYPAWENVILEKFMLISRKILNDPATHIKLTLIQFSLNQPIKEITRQQLANFSKRLPELQNDSITKKRRTID